MEERHEITLNVGGKRHRLAVEARRLLVDVIREDLFLTGTHIGCEHGVCGACTVLLDGEPVRSCLIFAVQADGQEVTVVEGLGENDRLSPLQQAFCEGFAVQCGFCTAGMLCTATALLKKNPTPTEHEIREAISGNLCRCTGYRDIVKAIQAAASQAGGR